MADIDCRDSRSNENDQNIFEILRRNAMTSISGDEHCTGDSAECVVSSPISSDKCVETVEVTTSEDAHGDGGSCGVVDMVDSDVTMHDRLIDAEHDILPDESVPDAIQYECVSEVAENVTNSPARSPELTRILPSFIESHCNQQQHIVDPIIISADKESPTIAQSLPSVGSHIDTSLAAAAQALITSHLSSQEDMIVVNRQPLMGQCINDVNEGEKSSAMDSIQESVVTNDSETLKSDADASPTENSLKRKRVNHDYRRLSSSGYVDDVNCSKRECLSSVSGEIEASTVSPTKVKEKTRKDKG